MIYLTYLISKWGESTWNAKTVTQNLIKRWKDVQFVA